MKLIRYLVPVLLLAAVSFMAGAAAAGMLGASATDPVCGMDVDEKRAAAAHRTLDHGGTTYYFCSDECKTKFAKEPGKYIAGTGTKG